MSAWLTASDRPVGAVLEGKDAAADLLAASVAGDNAALQSLLDSPQQATIATASAARVRGETKGPHDDPRRYALVLDQLNLAFIIDQAASKGQASAVEMLLDFAARQSIPTERTVTGSTVNAALTSNSGSTVAVLEALYAANPAVPVWALGHGVTPLSTAIQAGNATVVEWLVQHGASPASTAPPVGGIGFGNSLLGSAVKTRQKPLVDTLLANNCPIAASGALHIAALHGDVEIMQALIDRGADSNEILPKLSRGGVPEERMETWTPIDFAMYGGNTSAVALLRTVEDS